jgi:hypothetical protein
MALMNRTYLARTVTGAAVASSAVAVLTLVNLAKTLLAFESHSLFLTVDA